jgi:hypothetical protein
MLLPLPDETELKNWRPNAKGDLALQMVEWWAYLADILTFYNERIANSFYLRTADLPESVQRLIRILGYRPRPGIGARGTLAALMSKPTPFMLPQWFPIQSKPGPGKQPQIFELDADTPVSSPDAVPVNIVTTPQSLSGASSVLLRGAVTTVKVGDELLIMENGWKGADSNYALATAYDVQQEKDPYGKINTRVTFSSPLNSSLSGNAANYRILKNLQSTHLWSYTSAEASVVLETSLSFFEAAELKAQANNSRPPLIASTSVLSASASTTKPSSFVRQPSSQVSLIQQATLQQSAIFRLNEGRAHLASISRQIKVGDPVLFESTDGSPSPQLVSIIGYSEEVWYANTGDPYDPTQLPKVPKPPTLPPPPIPIPHSVILFTPALSNTTWNVQKTVVRYAWQDVGQLIDTPSPTAGGTSITLSAQAPAVFPTADNLPVLLEDANGLGVSAVGTVTGTPPSLQLTNISDPSATLTAPLRVLFDLLTVSRGKTVANEILGSGDATIAGQEFVLQKSPLTYLLSSDSTSGSDYKSTLRVWVDNIEWKEVPSFYAQPAGAHIFVTREDENNVTHVQFGDGVNGARLPSGVNNVIATYRYGSGADAPDAGQLTVITQPWPNLKAIRNPVAVGGGADPDSPKKIRRYGPQSVLTFGRAVSGDDYETIASQAPGVARAKSYWTWNAQEQRTLVTVYVGDNPSAVTAAKVALAGASDPNRPVLVKQATAVPVHLSLALRINPDYIPAPVISAVTAALLDDDTGLFGTSVIRIGQSIYSSQIYAACMSIPGVMAVHGLYFSTARHMPFLERRKWLEEIFILQRLYYNPTERYDPGEGRFFQLAAENLTVSSEVSEHAS